MHAAGILQPQASVITGDHVAVLNLGAHHVTLVPSDGELVVAKADIPFVCWLRSREHLDDPGVNSSGTVTVRAACFPVTEADGTLALVTDWSGTRSSEILVRDTSPETRHLTIEAVLTWARSAGGRYAIPNAGGLGAFEGMKLRFVNAPTQPYAQLGMDFHLPVGGLFPDANEEALRLSLASTWVTSRVLEGLKAELGGLPPPHGSTSVKLDDGVKLTALDIELGESELVVNGRIRKGIIRAGFTVTMSVVGTSPRDLAVDIADVSVDTDGFLAALTDFFTGGAIRNALEAGIRKAFEGRSGGSGLDDLLSSEVLNTVTALGTLGDAQLGVEVNGFVLAAHGITLTADLATTDPPPPMVKMTVQELTGHWRLLRFLDAWTPGSAIQEVIVDYGDGQTAALTGRQLGLTAAHEYAVGAWQARVTIKGVNGRTASAQVPITVT
jgi:hypothetical protein